MVVGLCISCAVYYCEIYEAKVERHNDTGAKRLVSF